jgi:hypothetical protein
MSKQEPRISDSFLSTIQSLFESDLTGHAQTFALLTHYDKRDICLKLLADSLEAVDTGLSKDTFFELFRIDEDIRRACYYLFIAFHGQRRDDRPLENTAIHSLRVATAVAQRLGDGGKRAVIEAVLHDVPEDCGLEHLRWIRTIFDDEIADGVALLTLPDRWERWQHFGHMIPTDELPGGICPTEVTEEIYRTEAWDTIRSRVKKSAKEAQLKLLGPYGLIVKAEDNLDALRSYCIDFNSGEKSLPPNKVDNFLQKLADRGEHHRSYMQRLVQYGAIAGQDTADLVVAINHELLGLERQLIEILQPKGIAIEIGHISRPKLVTRPAARIVPASASAPAPAA